MNDVNIIDMNKSLFNILIDKESSITLDEFLLSYGMNPKPVCPIQFIYEDTEE